jgi:hypothetical protein
MKAPYVPWSSLRSLCPQVSQEFPEVPKFPARRLPKFQVSQEFPEVPKFPEDSLSSLEFPAFPVFPGVSRVP